MTTFRWKTATTADWKVAADWDLASVPNNATADVVLGLTGAYTVTIASTDPAYTVDSVTLDNPAAALTVNGTLDLAGTKKLLDVAAGTFTLSGSGATLNGGTVALAGGGAVLGSGATLDGVTWIGRLAPNANSTVYVEGLTINAPSGTSPGTIDLHAAGATLSFLGSQTLDNVNIYAGASSGQYSYVYVNNGTETLTFGPHANFIQSDGVVQFYGPNAGETLVNQGVMSLSDGTAYDNLTGFVNSGTLALSNGEYFYIQGGYTFDNTGLLSIGKGTAFSATSASSFVNTGSITIAAGGSLTLGTITTGSLSGIANSGVLNISGYVTLAELATLSGLGTVNLTGTLDLGGGTLSAATTNVLPNLNFSGTIENGTIAPSSGTLALASNTTFSNVTVLGTLNAEGHSIYVASGLTVDTPAGGSPGTIDLRTSGSGLYFQTSATIDNAVLLMGATNGSYTYLYGNNSTNQTITLGSNLQLLQAFGVVQAYLPYGGDELINKGLMSLSGGTFYDYGFDFANAGTLALSGGENFTVQSNSATLGNSGLITVGTTTDLVLPANFVNTGSIVVAAGGTLSETGTYTLATLLPSAITDNGVLIVNGTLNLGGGTLHVGPGTSLPNLQLDALVENGTIVSTTGTVTVGSGTTLDGVTVLGSLEALGQLTIEGGLTVDTAGGGTPGTIDLRYISSYFYIAGNETLNNATLLLSNSTNYNEYNYIYGESSTNQTLTLGSNFSVQQTLTALNLYFPATGDTVVNDGTLNLSGGTFVNYATTLDNVGTIALSGSEVFDNEASTSYTLDNIGTIIIGAGSELETYGSNFVNAGSISIAAGGLLYVSGLTTLANLGHISGAGTVEIVGTLNLNGGTLNLGNTASNLQLGGFVENGTIIGGNGTIDFYSTTTLDGVTVLGSLEVGSNAVYVENGLTAESAAGASPGTIDLTGGEARLELLDSETLDHVVILGGASNYVYYVNGFLYYYDSQISLSTGGTGLTLGPNAQVVQTSGYFESLANSSGDYVDNQGTISLSGGTFYDYIATLTNDGTLALANGEVFTVEGAYVVTNDSLVTVGAGTTLDFSTSGIYTNSGTIAVAAGGVLEIAATSANFTNSGTIKLAAGATLDLASSTTLPHLGTVTGGGTLDVASGVTLDLGGGTLELGAGQAFSTLLLQGTVTDGTIKYDSTGASFISGGTIASGVTVVGTSDIYPQITLANDNLGGGTLDVKPGTADSNVLVAGTLSNGTLAADGGNLAFGGYNSQLYGYEYSTLSGITILGTVNFDAAGGYLYVVNGLTGGTASSPGTLTLGPAPGQSLYFGNSETVSHLTLNLAPSSGTIFVYAYGSLTLGTDVVLNTRSGTSSPVAIETGTFVNQGQINDTTAAFYEYATEFTNAGTIAIGSGDTFTVADTFANSGVITVATGGTLEIAAGTTFSNTGSITVASGAEFELGGSFTLAQLGSIVSGSSGLVLFNGTLNLNGGTLDTKAGTALGDLEITGTVENGTINPDTGTFALAGSPTFVGVTYLGTLSLPSNATYTIYNGLTAEAANGSAPGTIIESGHYSDLDFANTETLNNATIDIVPSSGYYDVLYAPNSAVLTLGTAVVVNSTTGEAIIEGGTLVNNGLINADGSTFVEEATNFTNAGTIAIGTGDTFNVNSYDSFTNTGLITVATGGVLNIGSQSTFANTGTLVVASGGTVELGGSLTLAQLGSIVAGSSGVVDFTGTLNLGGGTLDVKAGTALGNVELAGTIYNGTVNPDNGSLTLASGVTLQNITWLGPLNLPSATTITNGLTVDTAAGGHPGTIALGGNYTSYYFSNTQTLDNVTIDVTTVSGYYPYIQAPNSAVLTLGTNAVLNAGSSPVYLDGGTLVNKGLILASGPTFYEYLTQFTNAGTIAISNGDNFVYSGSSFANAGVLNIGTGSEFTLNYSSAFTNTGTFAIATGGTLVVGGSLTLQQLGTVVAGVNGLVDFTGTLNLNGGTMSIAPGTAFANVEINGLIENGTIVENGGALTFGSSATLDAIHLQGSLVNTGAVAYVEGGLSVKTAAGATPGTLDLSASGSGLSFLDSETLDNVVLIGPSAGTSSYVYNNQGTYSDTFGPHVLLLQTGGSEQIYGASAGQAFVNQGTLSLSGGNLQDYETSFTNQGTIDFAAGESFNDDTSGSFTNRGLIEALANSGTDTFTIGSGNYASLTSGTTLASGGALRVDDGATLDMSIAVLPTGDAGTITLAGPNSALAFYNTSNSIYVPVETNLKSVSSTGTLALLGGRSWTASTTFALGGLLQLAGGVFATSSLSVAATGHVLGYGWLAEPIANAGLIEAQGGKLVLSSPPTGAGTLEVDAAATLELGATTADGASFNGFAAALQLDAPAGYTGTLTGIIPSDTLILAGEAATAASSTGTTLTVTLAAGGTQSFTLAAPLTGIREGVTLDGAGNSDIVFYRYAVPNSVAPATIAFGEQHTAAVVTQGETIANTATTDGYSEALDAGFGTPSGAISAAGTVSLLPAGSTSSNALTVTLLTATDGVKSGSVVLTPQTDGTGIDGNGPLGLAGQTITATGTVFNYATATVVPTSIDFGDSHVGDSQARTLSVANSASADGYSENLDASFLAATGGIADSGAFGELAAGTTSAAMGVSLDTNLAGTIGGVATLDLVSDGSTIDTLGTTALASQTVALTGTVFNYATASVLAPNPISFANHHVGDTITQAVTLANTAASGAYSENLDASFIGTSGSLYDSGSIAELAAGSGSTALSVGLSSTVAGAMSGKATVDLASDGSTIDTLGTTALGTQTLSASGEVFNYATAGSFTPATINLGEAHTGASVTHTLNITNIAAAGSFSENLDAAFVGASGSIGGGGNVRELAAGGAAGTMFLVLNTANAGTRSGTATVGFTSDGSTIDNLGTTVLASQTVAATGTVFNYATASAIAPATIAFANHHVGDTISQAVTLDNIAATGTFSENLDAGFLAASTGVIDSGSVSALAAGASSTALLVGLASTTAGAIGGAATVELVSDGTGIDTLGTTVLGAQTITAGVNVFNYATASALAPNPITFANHHVGDSVTQAVTLANTAAGGLFSENLDAAFAGAGGGLSGSGAISGLAAGSSSHALTVTLDTALAGAISGTATVDLASDGGTIDNLGTTALAAQTIAAGGSVFNFATASLLAPDPVSFAEHHVGDTITQAVTLANTAASGLYSENLDAGFIGSSGSLTDSGSVSELAAGSSDSALTVTLSSAVAGTISGAATVDLVSDGSTLDNLGTTTLGTQTITASGEVFNYATASAVAPNPISFGNHHVGDTITQAVTLANTAASGLYSENLDASFNGTSGSLTGSGSIAELAAGSSSHALSVTLGSTVAGAISGTATVDLVSDGSTIDTLGTTVLGTQTLSASGDVFNYATAGTVAATTIDIGDAHVGGSAYRLLTITNTAAAGAFSENLDASFVGASGSLNGGGNVHELAAGGTADTMFVFLNTANAGTFSGTATVGFVSDGSTIDNLGTTVLARQTVAATGTVFNYATASTIAAVNFGVVHVGDTLSQALSVSNIAVTGAYSEALDAKVGGGTGGVSGSGTVSLLGAGSGASTGLSVHLAATSSGVATDTATIDLSSDGTGIDSLGTTVLSPKLVAVGATIDNYATLAVSDLSAGGAAVTDGGTIDLGKFAVGSNAGTLVLGVSNAATGLADLLNGSFSIAASGSYDPFGSSNVGSFGSVSAGQTVSAGPTITFDTGTIGDFTETVTIDASGSNSSGYSGALAPEMFTIFAEVPCYVRGTLVLTDRGEVAVEDLAVGDHLVNRHGVARPIVWIGRRSYAGRFAAANPRVMPVLIKQGAIDGNVPRRDLYVSPLHAMYLDGMLIPAASLINDASIVQVAAVETVDYFHLELASHDVIFAEGAQAESYLDEGNRGMFHNGGEHAGCDSPPAGYCAERIEHGPRVALVRARLAVRARTLGFVAPPALTIVLDHVGTRRVIVPAEAATLHLVSPEGRAIGDTRVLGALVTGLSIDGVQLDLADARLRRGFNEVEQHDERRVRWTDGRAVVALPEAAADRVVEVQVAAVATNCEIAHPVSLTLDAAGTFRIVVPAGTAALHLISTAGHADEDLRSLGALVTGLSIDGVCLDLADERLGCGFHAVELHDGTRVRWTDGHAVISLAPGATDGVVEVSVAAVATGRKMAA